MADFDQYASQYDQLLNDSIRFSGESGEYFIQYKAEWLARWAAKAPPARLLDYGCGIGNLSAMLRPLLPNTRIDGFDVSDESVQRVPEELRSQGTFSARMGDLGSDYGVIVVCNVLHHIPVKDRPDIMRALAARLRPGGVICVFEHNPMNPLTRLAVSRCAFDYDAVLLRPREVRGLLVGAGLRSELLDYIVFFPKPLALFRPLEPALKRLPMGAQFCAIGRRQ